METMHPALRRNRRRRRGMTLIEIMVVLVILGMIMGAIGYNVFEQQKSANRRMALSDTKSLANAIDMYRIKRSRMPDSLQALVPGEIKNLRDDPWGSPYVLIPGSGDEYEIVSYGPDKSQGGGDDVSSKMTNKDLEK